MDIGEGKYSSPLLPIQQFNISNYNYIYNLFIDERNSLSKNASTVPVRIYITIDKGEGKDSSQL
jgi:hypothetical protein